MYGHMYGSKRSSWVLATFDGRVSRRSILQEQEEFDVAGSEFRDVFGIGPSDM